MLDGVVLVFRYEILDVRYETGDICYPVAEVLNYAHVGTGRDLSSYIVFHTPHFTAKP